MNLNDSWTQRPSGLFVLNIFRRGVLVDRMEEPNLVVNNAKAIHARLLGSALTADKISQFGVGENGTAAVVGNTSLAAAYTKALDTVLFPTSTSVSFAFSLTAGEANGKAISEFGLLTGGGVLYARKVRSSPLNKDSDIALSGTWTITF